MFHNVVVKESGLINNKKTHLGHQIITIKESLESHLKPLKRYWEINPWNWFQTPISHSSSGPFLKRSFEMAPHQSTLSHQLTKGRATNGCKTSERNASWSHLTRCQKVTGLYLGETTFQLPVKCSKYKYSFFFHETASIFYEQRLRIAETSVT